MDILHLKPLHRPGLHLPRLRLDDDFVPRATTSIIVILCLFAGGVLYLTIALLSALHAW
ncbi:hypothetical protein [Silvimonas iriomotensis]|uniref:Uncharacterized protein n=1 Tax=Silvimonas iriomotensis TaxID=449662 RepID=A0ABQ2P5Q5_9NEIS|nr:hypothetical protein [Silvimonas iriomotensis]GGP18899.1 hypothetical protein GCM10010970_07940 [Silvimonas iriomotensis]